MGDPIVEDEFSLKLVKLGGALHALAEDTYQRYRKQSHSPKARDAHDQPDQNVLNVKALWGWV